MYTVLLFTFAALMLVAWGEDLGGATIDSVTIDPDIISLSDTGMTDEFFIVTIVVSGFEGEIDGDSARVFVQEPEIDAVPGTTDVSGDTITLGMIAKTWVGNLDPGEYDVGAEVRSDTESVTQRDLATITIEE